MESFFFVLSRARDKEKILSLHEESNPWPSDLCSDAYLMNGSTTYPKLIFFFILITYLVDIVRRNSVLVTDGS